MNLRHSQLTNQSTQTSLQIAVCAVGSYEPADPSMTDGLDMQGFQPAGETGYYALPGKQEPGSAKPGSYMIGGGASLHVMADGEVLLEPPDYDVADKLEAMGFTWAGETGYMRLPETASSGAAGETGASAKARNIDAYLSHFSQEDAVRLANAMGDMSPEAFMAQIGSLIRNGQLEEAQKRMYLMNRAPETGAENAADLMLEISRDALEDAREVVGGISGADPGALEDVDAAIEAIDDAAAGLE